MFGKLISRQNLATREFRLCKTAPGSGESEGADGAAWRRRAAKLLHTNMNCSRIIGIDCIVYMCVTARRCQIYGHQAATQRVTGADNAFDIKRWRPTGRFLWVTWVSGPFHPNLKRSGMHSLGKAV